MPDKESTHSRSGQVTSAQAAAYFLKNHFSSGPFVWLLFLGWSVGFVLTRMVPSLFIARIIVNVQDGFFQWSVNSTEFMLAIGSVIFGEVLLRVSLHYQSIVAIRVADQLMIESHRVLLEKSLSFHADSFAGDLTSKVNKLSSNAILFVDTLYFEIATFVGMFLFAVVVLGPSNLLAVAVYLVVLLGYTLLATPFVRKRLKLIEVRSRLESERTGLLVDSLSNIAAVKSFARETSESERFAAHVHKTGAVTLHSWLYSVWRVDPITVLFYCLMVFGPLASLLIFSESVDLSQLFLMYTFMSLLGTRIWDFALIWRNVEVQLAEAVETLEVLWSPNEVTDSVAVEPLEIGKGEISLQNIGFSYESAKSLFKNFDLTVAGGQKVGLVGPSGGGKTTLVKLMLRFMDVQEGNIVVDGLDIAKVSQSDLRESIAYIPQEPALFHRSIRENILYGHTEVSEQEMVDAARRAYAHDFIVGLPNGYDTLVGERGVKLSGGQRQRVAIARAFLKSSSILILDEATSALDSESEALVQAALADLIVDKTVVSIAHRLSTLQIMDRLIVLESGKIIEDGSHADLLAHDGTYTQLWQHQSGGYLSE